MTPSLGGNMRSDNDADVYLHFMRSVTQNAGAQLNGFWSDCVSPRTALELLRRGREAGAG